MAGCAFQRYWDTVYPTSATLAREERNEASNRYKPFFACQKTPVDSAYELILGSSADLQFGPVLLVGQGGQGT
jgi:hypothetical protein